MAGNFPPGPWIQPPPTHLGAQLIPAVIPTGIISVGAGSLLLTGVGISLVNGQSVGVGPGLLALQGTQAALSLGVVPGNNVGPGQLVLFGYPVSVGVSVGPAPTPSVDAFAPALSELGLDAWERVGLKAGELTVAHVASMRRSMNLVLSRWSNRGINLWKVAATTITLRTGVATYALPATVIDVLDTYISSGGTDLLIAPISRNIYAGLPNKLLQGWPVEYWVDRTITPSLTVWPVPDATGYTLTYYGFTQIQDADPASGNTAQLPYRFLEAFTAAVAAHLSQKFADPNRAVALDAYAKECWAEAEAEDRERVTITIAPDLSGYWN